MTTETKPQRTRKKAEITDAPVVAYKGFDKNLQCQGYQYEIGKEYVHTGKVEQCASGFHACQNPLDVLDYYPHGGDNRFAKVTLSGEIDRSDDKKWAAARLTVEAELAFPALVSAAITWVVEACKADKSTDGNVTSGHSATNASSGHSAKNASSGDSATNASSGHYATNASSGHSAKNASSGHSATNASSGHSATNASSGHSATNVSSGHSAKNASSGHSAKNVSSGDYATNASSGHSAKNASSGHSAKNASSGHSATNASSGHYATNASSGHYGNNEATGEHAVITGAGRDTYYKGANGVWISAAEYGEIDGKYICIGFATGQAGYDGVPVDTWLIAKGGKLVPA